MDASEPELHGSYNIDTTWKLKFAWLPEYCSTTGERIWLEWAYQKTTRYHTPPGWPEATLRSWVSRDVWLIKQLKGTI